MLGLKIFCEWLVYDVPAYTVIKKKIAITSRREHQLVQMLSRLKQIGVDCDPTVRIRRRAAGINVCSMHSGKLGPDKICILCGETDLCKMLDMNMCMLEVLNEPCENWGTMQMPNRRREFFRSGADRDSYVRTHGCCDKHKLAREILNQEGATYKVLLDRD